jgi:ABC-type uncharacterized transport system ATPase subunit
MALIEALGLTKVFRRPDKQPGLKGAAKHLVQRKYSEHVAVRGLDLVVDDGEAVAYVGPNGAGKSTTIKMLAGILVPTSGTLSVGGVVPYKSGSPMPARSAWFSVRGPTFGGTSRCETPSNCFGTCTVSARALTNSG